MSDPGKRRSGFTIVELLIIVVVLSLIAMAIIPLFLSTLQVGKQKRTMSDINLVGRAMMSWINDQLGAAAAGQAAVPIRDYGEPLTREELEDFLVPRYLPRVPEFDAWGANIDYRFNIGNLGADELMAIRSSGSDKIFSTDTYVSGPFDPRAFSEDIVWVDGIFVRWPEKN